MFYKQRERVLMSYIARRNSDMSQQYSIFYVHTTFSFIFVILLSNSSFLKLLTRGNKHVPLF